MRPTTLILVLGLALLFTDRLLAQCSNGSCAFTLPSRSTNLDRPLLRPSYLRTNRPRFNAPVTGPRQRVYNFRPLRRAAALFSICR